MKAWLKTIVMAVGTATCMALAACGDGNEDVIWIEDKGNRGLPIYSEWGYNTYGAYFNGESYTYEPEYMYGHSNIFVKTSGEQIYIALCANVYYPQPQLRFTLPAEGINKFSQLTQLDKMTFDLADGKCGIEIAEKFDKYSYKAGCVPFKASSGKLTVSRAQKVYLDGVSRGVILSGTFEFEGVTDNSEQNAYKVTLGRFDINIDTDNFWDWDHPEDDVEE